MKKDAFGDEKATSHGGDDDDDAVSPLSIRIAPFRLDSDTPSSFTSCSAERPSSPTCSFKASPTPSPAGAPRRPGTADDFERRTTTTKRLLLLLLKLELKRARGPPRGLRRRHRHGPRCRPPQRRRRRRQGAGVGRSPLGGDALGPVGPVAAARGRAAAGAAASDRCRAGGGRAEGRGGREPGRLEGDELGKRRQGEGAAAEGCRRGAFAG